MPFLKEHLAKSLYQSTKFAEHLLRVLGNTTFPNFNIPELAPLDWGWWPIGSIRKTGHEMSWGPLDQEQLRLVVNPDPRGWEPALTGTPEEVLRHDFWPPISMQN
ncbi:MAG: hypothetical protein EXS41_00320 [Opitutaceae bacterium]|nr:hypothetical protein [Opitutaceae bacterium]